MGNFGHPSTEEELDTMIKEPDSDGDGSINLEVIELNTKDIDSDRSNGESEGSFYVFAIDNNGSILLMMNCGMC